MALGGVVTDIKPTFTVNCSNSDMPDIVRDAVSLKKNITDAQRTVGSGDVENFAIYWQDLRAPPIAIC